jgi:TRAP-type transport system periplasmic protein
MCIRTWQARLIAVLTVVAVCTVAATAQAQRTLTLGGSDAIGSILDRQNDRFTKLCNDRAVGKLKNQLHPR